MTTDTNQAREDELDEILFNLCDLSYASFTTQEETDRVADQLDYDRDEAKQAIQSIIRTEKLKLLAEVRERVIGSNETDFLGTEKQFASPRQSRNSLRAEQLKSLAKLEAEL